MADADDFTPDADFVADEDRSKLPPPYNVPLKGKNPGMEYQPPLVKEDPLAYVVGGGIGKKIGSAAYGVTAPIAKRVASKVVETGWAKVRGAIEHTAEHSLTSALAKEFAVPVADVAAAGASKAAGALATAGAAALPVAGTVAGATAGNAASNAANNAIIESKPFTNIIERLRASAVANPRAAELLAKIQAGNSQPVGTVTQSEGVAP